MRTTLRLSALLPLLLAGCVSTQPVRLTRVVLYQSGVGYFEREGTVENGTVNLRLAAHEVDDVLTTLTVVDPERPEQSVSPSMVMPRERAESGTTQDITLRLGASSRNVTVAYAAPTAAWRASYRVVLPEERGSTDAWFQAWAVVDNTSGEDWTDVDLTLATDAPLSFAVDLRTPRIVERPNIAGYHASAIAFGPVTSERSTRGSRDGDAILDEDDLCPDEAEDVDGFQDLDGCPDPDNDADGILDAIDECPGAPEGYNGIEDEDGCPDAGRVIVSDSRMAILERIVFAPDSASIMASSVPILDAIAATLNGSPQVSRTEVQGHADSGEEHPWSLSAERAGAVQSALVRRGVAASRLQVSPMGDTQPIGGEAERNRRVEFQIQQADDETPAPSRGAVRRESLARASSSGRLPEVGAGGTRFPVARQMSIPAGTSAMVGIMEGEVDGEDILLYRIDRNVPSSVTHPFRALRLVNRSGVDLIAGPLALFSRGELVGEGLLGSLAVGENAFVPYAVDGSTSITAVLSYEHRPARIVSIVRGVVSVERIQTRRTRYSVEVGARAPARLFVRHARTSGFEPHSLPPNTETNPGAVLAPIPLSPGTDSVLSIAESRAVPDTIELANPSGPDLRPFLEGSELDPVLEARLVALLDDRDALVRIHEETSHLRRQLAELGTRTAELRRSVEALDERAGRSVAPIRRRVGERLRAAIESSEAIAARLAQARASEIEARLRLREAALELEMP